MTGTIPLWATVLLGVLSGGATVPLVTWLLARIDRHDRLLTREDLDDALEDSTVIRDVRDKLDRDWKRFDKADQDRLEIRDDMRQLQLNQLRAELFAHTRSRTQHERQLEAGREYLDRGGNGLGHARFDWLTHDYEQRLADCDWDYTKTHHDND